MHYLLNLWSWKRRPGAVVVWTCLFSTIAAAAGQEPARDGKAIYLQQCAECHGETGQGNKDLSIGPLVGDKSLGQVVRYIEESMPEESPEDCIGKDAQQVARYLYDTFYSPAAQARNTSARIELSRLTIRQYRNTVTDLIGSFRGSFQLGQERGLQGRYFNKGRPSGKPELSRTDATVDFHFGPNHLPPEPLDKIKGFTARWQGSIIAPETGKYKIIVRTNQAIRLWLNDADNALIDAWVQSGDQTRHTASIFLLGGRVYPLRLDFTARQQGVEDRKKYDEHPREIFIELCWEPPAGVEQVIANRYLVPQRGPELFVVATPFPPDDRSHGYLRGISVSKAWDDATTSSAIETAGYVVEHLKELAKIGDNSKDREQKLRAFCRQFVTRAFRRPLADEIAQVYIDRRFEGAPDLETAVKRVVLMTLQSPRALYLDFSGQQTDGYDVASMLSFALWDSLPDAPLLQAAAEDQLTSQREIAKQSERMVRDPRARSKLRHFLHSWLQIEHAHDLAKSKEKYPNFDQQLVADLQTSLDLFLDDTVWGDDGDFRDLLRSNQIYLNGRLAQYYGYDLPPDAPFQRVDATDAQHIGIVSHPYMMSSLAYTEFSSPIHRGVFLIRNVLGRTLRPPPAAVAPASPDLNPGMTTRQRVTMQTSPDVCQACHTMINPVGFALEYFDAVGRYRDMENGKPIDAAGVYESASGDKTKLNNAQDLAEFLANSRQTHRAFALQLFNYLVKQRVAAFGADMADQVDQAFAEQDYNIPKIMAEIATRASLVICKRS